MSAQTQVVILGGGYAGLLAAVRLANRTKQQRAAVTITLVNATGQFVERIRLHEAAAGTPLRERSIARILRGTGVQFIEGWVTALDPDQQSLTVRIGDALQRLPYDYLIYALGSIADKERVPGVREHTVAIGNAHEVAALRERLPQVAAEHGRVVVVGGGLTGIETAAELAETYPDLRVQLVTSGQVGAKLSDEGRAHLREVFDRLGVTVTEDAAITAVHAGHVQLADGTVLPFDLCIWGASFTVPALAREAGLAVNGQGQLVLDDMLRSVSHGNVYGAGDGAQPAASVGVPIRMGCATAMPMGAHAADNLAAVLSGEPQQMYRFGYVVQCISLGRRDGLIQFVHADDRPMPRILTGWGAAQFKETICKFAFRSILVEKRMPGSYLWRKPRVQAADAAMRSSRA